MPPAPRNRSEYRSRIPSGDPSISPNRPSRPEPIDVVTIRHAPTAWNAAGRIQGHMDVPLSEDGRRALARRCLPERFGAYRVHSSPLARAVETAALLGLDAPVLDRRLMEMDWGEWEGTTRAALRRGGPRRGRAQRGEGTGFPPAGRGEPARGAGPAPRLGPERCRRVAARRRAEPSQPGGRRGPGRRPLVTACGRDHPQGGHQGVAGARPRMGPHRQVPGAPRLDPRAPFPVRPGHRRVHPRRAEHPARVRWMAAGNATWLPSRDRPRPGRRAQGDALGSST